METTIYSLPRDIICILVTNPFCGLRRTCKWFRELCTGIFSRKTYVAGWWDIISSAHYIYKIPRCLASGSHVWDGNELTVLSLRDTYRPLCNYLMLPQHPNECSFILCVDDELRHFAHMMDCKVYKLQKVATSSGRVQPNIMNDDGYDGPTSIPSCLQSDVVLISENEHPYPNVWGRMRVKQLDIVYATVAIRGMLQDHICVYLAVDLPQV